jgi:virginiamycin B lyase
MFWISSVWFDLFFLWFFQTRSRLSAFSLSSSVASRVAFPMSFFSSLAGPDGNVWFAEGSASTIASITRNGVITEYQFSFFGVSVGITTGSDANIWFTDQTDHAVWRFEIATGTFTEFPTPTPNSFPGDITAGSDGNMWFT